MKTFKSSAVSGKEIVVRSVGDNHIMLSISKDNLHVEEIMLSGVDAPSLALTVLEGSGVIPENRIFREGDYEHLQFIAYDLNRYLVKSHKRTAEAKEQAELEADAVKLRNAWHEDPLDESPPSTNWLAVARKAREMKEGS